MTNDTNADRLVGLIRKHNRPRYAWSDGLRIGELIRRAFVTEQGGGPADFSQFLDKRWPVPDGPRIGDSATAVNGVHPQLLISVRRVVASCQRSGEHHQTDGTNRGADGDGTDG